MRIGDQDVRSVWWDDERQRLGLIDQRLLPHRLEQVYATTVDEAAHLITDMAVRGAPAIGATAAYAMVLGADDPERSAQQLCAARPTARDLFTAVDHMLVDPSLTRAHAFVEGIVDACAAIGRHGRTLLADIAAERGRLHVLTHCHAGALATVDHGTALAPLHALAREPLGNGIRPHVFVSETRPRFQGAITAWELSAAGIDHTVVVDNAAPHLIARGEIDVVITGADRVVANGDAANKIGTYVRALAAHAHGIPFYIALPATTYDPDTANGAAIAIEERSPNEVLDIAGHRPYAAGTQARNPAFDVTPAALITGYITERGVVGHPADAGRRRPVTTHGEAY